MLYASMVEASERAQSTNGFLPKGHSGRAPLLPKIVCKNFRSWSFWLEAPFFKGLEC
jgi:hypothetical protein